MRITDGRYDRDRLRLATAFRLIGLEARTHTIRQATGLSDDRIRRLYRDYFKSRPELQVRRRRGKSPRQMAFFKRSLDHELQTALLAAMLRQGGLLVPVPAGRRLALEEVDRLCDIYDAFAGLTRACLISFEHAWYLLHALSSETEYVLAPCQDCQSLWVHDTLDLLPDNCAACRMGLYPR